MPGVNVFAVGTSIGTSTDFDGNFEIDIPADAQGIEFSFMGFTNQTFSIKVAQSGNIDVVLLEDANLLDDIVVVGYGVQKKSDITGSIVKVEGKQIQNATVLNPISALQGQVPGVRITSNSGAPGGSVSVRVRGVGTVNDASPLYVVDGMPVSGIGFLGANDIESIEVLKDASATAIYGARGANGVIMVTTKKGSKNNSSINFDAYYGVQSIDSDLGLMNSQQWYNYQKDKGSDVSEVEVDDAGVPVANTNWLNEVSRAAPMKSYNLSFIGGSEKSTYNVSLGYSDQDGVINGSSYEKLTGRLNGTHQVNDKVKVGSNVVISQANRVYNSGGVVAAALKFDPVTPIEDEFGNLVGSSFTDYPNPVGMYTYKDYEVKNTQVLGNIYVEYEIIKGLKFRSSVGTEMNRRDSYQFYPTYEISTNQLNAVSGISRGYTKTDYWILENTLNYTKEFGDHSITALVGYSAENSRTETLAAGRSELTRETENFQVIDGGVDTLSTNSGGVFERGIESVLGRINYSYSDRYLLTASVRRDGSSKFGSNYRYGVFPSFALGWRVINESFMSDLRGSWLNNLKVRAGWGVIGNENIAAYKYQSLVLTNSTHNRYIFGTNGAESRYPGAYSKVFGNENIHWEETASTNIGIDFSMFSSRLSGSIDVYTKDTNDMLLPVNLPDYMGYTGSPILNIGKVNNKGLELSVNWREVVGDFTYSIGGNIDFVKNNVVDMSFSDVLTGGSVRGFRATRTEEGREIASYYGYNAIGVFKTQEQVDEYAYDGYGLGDPIFEDINNDGIIDSDDKTYLGSYMPDFSYSINASVAYKGIDFSIQFMGVQGNEIYNGNKYYTHYSADMTNKHTDVTDQWRPNILDAVTGDVLVEGNEDGNLPKYNSVHSVISSSLYVEDGSFLRLKDVQLGYTFSNVDKVGIKSLRVYINGRNMLTLTNYSGFDPEIGQYSGALTRGVDIGTYPVSKIISAGVNLSF